MLISGPVSARELAGDGTGNTLDAARVAEAISATAALNNANISATEALTQQLATIQVSATQIQVNINNILEILTKHADFKPGVCQDDEVIRGINADGSPVCAKRSKRVCKLLGVGEVFHSMEPTNTSGVWLGDLSPDECAEACANGDFQFCNRFSKGSPNSGYTGPADGVCRGSQKATGVCSGEACGCPGGGCYDRRWECLKPE